MLTPDDLFAPCQRRTPWRAWGEYVCALLQPLSLAQETVTFSGEAVAAVVAQNRYSAEDMVDAVQVVYAPPADGLRCERQPGTGRAAPSR